MVIIRTKAEEISIQAVSPESNFAGAAKALRDVKSRLANATPILWNNFIYRPPMLKDTRNPTAGHLGFIKNHAAGSDAQPVVSIA